MESFIFDTNILIALDKYNPLIFPSLWQNIYSMIESKQLFSINEVERELSKRDDRIKKTWQNIQTKYGFFKDLTELPNSEKYWDFLPSLDYFEEFQKGGENKKYWADPFLITIGKLEDITVVSGEKSKRNPSRKIPFVCSTLNVKCMDLDEFMIYNGWCW